MDVDREPHTRAAEGAKEARKAKRAHQAAQAISFAALLLLFLACTLYLVLAYTGWNQYTAAVALFCGGLAGYPCPGAAVVCSFGADVCVLEVYVDLRQVASLKGTAQALCTNCLHPPCA